MTALQSASLIGQRLTIVDARTGQAYALVVFDAKRVWGKLRVRSETGGWFEPTDKELGAQNKNS